MFLICKFCFSFFCCYFHFSFVWCYSRVDIQIISFSIIFIPHLSSLYYSSFINFLLLSFLTFLPFIVSSVSSSLAPTSASFLMSTVLFHHPPPFFHTLISISIPTRPKRTNSPCVSSIKTESKQLLFALILTSQIWSVSSFVNWRPNYNHERFVAYVNLSPNEYLQDHRTSPNRLLVRLKGTFHRKSFLFNCLTLNCASDWSKMAFKSNLSQDFIGLGRTSREKTQLW